MALGQDANWDLGNYHLYNPWAWLHGRYGFDLAPAQLQTFHNPLVDVPLHAMVTAGWPPRWIAAALAVPAGVAAFALAQVAAILFRDAEPRHRPIAIAVATLIGVTGAAGLGTVGNTMNEWPGAALVIVAIWMLVRDLANGATPAASVIGAGLLVGLACGLKLTAAPAAVGLSIALLARRPFAVSLRSASLFGVAVLAGVAIAAGHWMLLMQELYGSPLFPYFNEVFRSPLVPPEPVLDRRFGPASVLEWLAFPFALLQPTPGYVAETAYRDARFPIVAALVLVVVATRLLRGPHAFAGATASPATQAAWRFVAVTFAITFAAWAVVYAYYRYLLALELLAGVLAVALLMTLVPRVHARKALIALGALLVLGTSHARWGRVPFGDAFVDVRVPPVEPNALVLLTADAPMAYVLTRLPADARHVGIHNNLIRVDRPSGLREQARQIVAAHRGPIYQLTPVDRPAGRELAAYGLRRDGPCAKITSNLGYAPLDFCRVTRADP
jgi:hypothetical protein